MMLFYRVLPTSNMIWLPFLLILAFGTAWG